MHKLGVFIPLCRGWLLPPPLPLCGTPFLVGSGEKQKWKLREEFLCNCWHFIHPTIWRTGCLWQSISYRDRKGLSCRFDHSCISLSPLEYHHTGAASSPALLFHMELQPAQNITIHSCSALQWEKWGMREWSAPIAEGQWEFALGLLLIALAQQTEELGLKRGLQQTVILSFMKNEEVILPCATGKLRKTFFYFPSRK